MPLSTPMGNLCLKTQLGLNKWNWKEIAQNKVFNLAGGPSCRTSYEEFLGINFRMNGLGKVDFPPKTFAERISIVGII